MYNSYPQRYYGSTYGDDIKVVNGRSSAERYQMMPNSRTILMDANEDIFYLCQSDATGMTSVIPYRFERIQETNIVNDYVTKKDLEEMLSKYELTIKQPKTEPKQQSVSTKSQPIASQF